MKRLINVFTFYLGLFLVVFGAWSINSALGWVVLGCLLVFIAILRT